MKGIETRYVQWLQFQITQERLSDSIGTVGLTANPTLWWVTVTDRDYFGDNLSHDLCGGVATKSEAERVIVDHLLDKQHTQHATEVAS